MIRLAILAILLLTLGGGASAHRSLGTFHIDGCECTPNSQTVILGWRGVQPGNKLQVYRDGTTVYQGANPQGPALNVYLHSQPLGQHGYQVCAGTITNLGFTPQACSQTLTLTVS